MKKILTISLILFTLTSSLQARCYTDQEISILASTIKDHEVCKKTLALREQFIQENLTKYQPQIETSWWQEPSYIAGGVIISFGFGIAIGAVLLSK